jgi:hypothetical protein
MTNRCNAIRRERGCLEKLIKREVLNMHQRR